MSRFRDEQGFALASAIMLLAVIMALGLGLLLFTDNQQKSSGSETASETAFNVAEAALDTQIGQISREWPSEAKTAVPSETVTRCEEATETSTNGCPTGASMNVAYPTSAAKCSTTNGQPKDAWRSSGETSGEWTTYVRDDGPNNESGYFNSSAEQSQLNYDANKDNKVWVRAVGIVQCRMVVVTSLVTRQEVTANFPTTLMSANWFTTGNNGKGHEVIVEGKNPESGASQNGEVRMRCSGWASVEACESYREGQLANAEVKPPPGAPTPTLTATQLAAFRQQAEYEKTYYGPGVCPTGLPSGKPVYVTGPCAVTGGKKEVGNSQAKPGFLIVVNGTFELGGQAEFWGVVYCANKQESSGKVVIVGGNASLKGEIVVDGNGGMEVGENHQKNVEFDPRAAGELKIYAGATPTRNTFRVLATNE